MERGNTRRVALIAGVTGMVGASLAKLLLETSDTNLAWKVYGLSRHNVPTWMQDLSFHHIRCDLLDRHQANATLNPLSDVTHVFFVTWTSRSTEQENCVANTAMLRNTLEPILASCKNLQHVCLQTGIKHYIGSHLLGFSSSAATSPQLYMESANRLPDRCNFYYAQEDYLFEALCRSAAGGAVSWSVHRPGLIFGLSPSSLVNVVYALAVYASICKHESAPLIFTGSQRAWESHLNASDADLIAEQHIWAATHIQARNQAFNVSNGDDVTWKDVWMVLAQSFGIPYKQQAQSFVTLMQTKFQVWEELVQHYGLLHITTLEQHIMGWQILDTVLHKMPTGKSSMHKSQAFGFHHSRDTKESLIYWINKMREKNLVL